MLEIGRPELQMAQYELCAKGPDQCLCPMLEIGRPELQMAQYELCERLV